MTVEKCIEKSVSMFVYCVIWYIIYLSWGLLYYLHICLLIFYLIYYIIFAIFFIKMILTWILTVSPIFPILFLYISPGFTSNIWNITPTLKYIHITVSSWRDAIKGTRQRREIGFYWFSVMNNLHHFSINHNH